MLDACIMRVMKLIETPETLSIGSQFSPCRLFYERFAYCLLARRYASWKEKKKTEGRKST
jgi:hypothetical protein